MSCELVTVLVSVTRLVTSNLVIGDWGLWIGDWIGSFWGLGIWYRTLDRALDRAILEVGDLVSGTGSGHFGGWGFGIGHVFKVGDLVLARYQNQDMNMSGMYVCCMYMYVCTVPTVSIICTVLKKIYMYL